MGERTRSDEKRDNGASDVVFVYCVLVLVAVPLLCLLFAIGART